LNPYIVDCPFSYMFEEDGSAPRWDEVKTRVSDVEKLTRKEGATELNDPLIVQFHLTGAEHAMASLQDELSPEGDLRRAKLKETVAEGTIAFVDRLIRERDSPDRRRSREWAVQNLQARRALRIDAEARAADPQVLEALDKLKTVKSDTKNALKALKAKVREIENKTPGGGYVNIPVRQAVPEAPFPEEAAAVVQPNPKINRPQKNVADLRAAAVDEAAAARDQLARRRNIADQGDVPVLAADAAAAAAARREEQERRNKALYDEEQKKNAPQNKNVANPGAGGPGGSRRGKKKSTKKTARKRRKAGTRRMR
jgi:hypothetical protein